MGAHTEQVDSIAGLRNQLNSWDFIGVFHPVKNADEYDCLIEPLLGMLQWGKDRTEISAWLWHEIEDHFGMSEESIADADPHAFARVLTAWWAGRPE